MHAQDDADHLRESADEEEQRRVEHLDEAVRIMQSYDPTLSPDYAGRVREADAGQALADDECFCVTPTVATNEHGETWCSVCGERLILRDEGRHPLDQSDV